MKKIKAMFLAFMMAFMAAGCASVSFANAVLLNTPDGKKIAVQTVYNETQHGIEVNVCYLDRCYGCDVIYDKDATSVDITVEIDTDAIEKSGMIEIAYKNQRYQCRVK